MRIKKRDNVKILRGKDRNKTGKVLRVFPADNKITVENINLVKKHRKSRKAGEQSERVTIAMPINIANVQFICSKCSKPSRIGYKTVDSKKVRICKKCEAEV